MKATVTYELRKKDPNSKAIHERDYRHVEGAFAAFFRLVEQMRSGIAQRKNYFKSITITITPEENE